MEEIRFNLAAPDLLCICVDERQHGESSGRVYCCYAREAVHFSHEYQLIKMIEELLDRIGYPQCSVKIRSFQEKKEKKQLPKPEKILEGREIVGFRGKIATFLVHIKYRQNATWQGEICWVEKARTVSFRSELELLKLMDNALELQ